MYRLIIMPFLLSICDYLGAQSNYLDTVYQWDGYRNNYSYSSIKVSEDKFVITAYAYNGNGNFVLNAFCINFSGDTLWNRKYFADTLTSPFIRGSRLDNQKNIVMAGSAYNTNDSIVDGLLVKIDTLGNLFWMKTYPALVHGLGIFGGLYGQFPIITNDNHYLLVCQNGDSIGISDFFIEKTDTNGNELAQWQYLNTSYDFPICGLQSSDGGFVFAGNSTKFDTPTYSRPNIYVIKADSAGNKEWETGIVSFYTDPDLKGDAEADAIIEESDGFILSGERGWGSNPLWVTTNDPSEGLEKCWLGKISKTDGQILWDKLYGIDSADYAWFYGFTRTSDGGFALCGALNFDTNTSNVGYIVETDSIGNPIWSSIIQHPLNPIQYTDQMDLYNIHNINNGFLVTGIRWPGWPVEQSAFPYAMTIDSNGCWNYGCSTISSVKEIMPYVENVALLIYPSPTDGLLYINVQAPNTNYDFTLQIYDVGGRLVQNEEHIIPNQPNPINVITFANGLYFTQVLDAGNVVGRGRFVKE